ncbi:hypothetical protein BED47_07790 [Gottfriedia luciferensis]|uniref:DUF5071 domain-containing protein n=1 Tax=Gottfriedia luciferensis TaxID=178774 RepID=A0ABX2ZPA0_9BACI|nr:hypothetical protein [Gottfriedia luciferensis]ODG91545.1 hypothetical protein BED47_07790 [Gottfriedia luciferensis]
MTNYIELEDAEIIYHVYNLNWLLPKDIQEDSFEILSQINPDKTHLLIPKYGKSCWLNGVLLIKKIGYPNNKKALPKLAGLLQDRNWPGALESIKIFREIGKEVSVPYIEVEIENALQCNDTDWLEHLLFACDSLCIERDDFNNKSNYDRIVKLVKEL